MAFPESIPEGLHCWSYFFSPSTIHTRQLLWVIMTDLYITKRAIERINLLIGTAYDEMISNFRNSAHDFLMKLPPTVPRDLPNSSGVYFVFEEERIIYIGKAVDLFNRWRGHRFKKEVDCGMWLLRWKPFDEKLFCNSEHEETFFISLIRPRYNRIAKCKVWPNIPQ